MAVGIVEKLQAECLDDSIPVSTLLRKAKLIASKLKLAEFEAWVDREQGGYDDTPRAELPRYRHVRGQPEAQDMYGWKPIMGGTSEFQEAIGTATLAEPIAELEALIQDKEGGGIAISYSPKAEAVIHRGIGRVAPLRLDLGMNKIIAVVDAVRNTLLNWSLELEKAGVLGEGLSFNERDKVTAAHVTNNFFHSNVGVLGSVTDNARVSNAQGQ